MRSIDKARILILNYNGAALMKECLPSIVEAAGRSRRRVSVTVIDNQSTDDSVGWLEKNFPSVNIFKTGSNKILCAYNDALRSVEEDVVILLNNDIRVDGGFADPLIDPFEKDEKVFSSGSKCLDFDGKGYQGEKSIAGFRWGLFWTDSRYTGYLSDVDRPSWTAQVALGAFDRKKFLELGGYDDLYLPGTWEDTDLSWSAYRRGWHCVYEPKSVIYHKGQVTFNREFGKKESAVIAYRNSFLFVWKNFCKSSFIVRHWVFLPMRLLLALVKGNTAFLKGFMRALELRNLAFSKGLKSFEIGGQLRSKNEILDILKSRHKTAG